MTIINLLTVVVIEFVFIVLLIVYLISEKRRKEDKLSSLKIELSETKEKTSSRDEIVGAPPMAEIKSAIGTAHCLAFRVGDNIPFSCYIRGVSCYKGSGYSIEAMGPGHIHANAYIFYKGGTEESELSPEEGINIITFKF